MCWCFLVVGASSGLDGYIKLWDIETGKLLKSIDGGPGVCACVCVFGVCSLLYNNQPLENTIESGEVIWSKKCR